MSEPATKPRLIVGLGNPGPRYADTRHNVGFAVAEAVVATATSARAEVHALARTVEIALAGGRVLVALPSTYMNDSGRAVRFLAQRAGAPPGEILLIHDELDLPLGDVRLKRGGGDGGHRGLRSVTECLDAADYVRLRVGIGRPGPTFVGTVADFVLEAVPLVDRPALESSVSRAVEAITLSVESGYAAAMNVVNQRIAR